MQLCILRTLAIESNFQHPFPIMEEPPRQINGINAYTTQTTPVKNFDYKTLLQSLPQQVTPYPQGANAGNFKQYILPPPTPAAADNGADNGDNLVDFGDDFAYLADPAPTGNTNRYPNGDLLLALLYSAKLRF